MKIYARQMLGEKGWLKDCTVRVAEGRIVEIQDGTHPGQAETVVDTLLPALANLHSHAFQRAMAGMTEFRAAGKDSFWTWRALMYRFLDRLTPEHMEAIAALVYMEMLEAGYAAVGEFHYVHHQPGGQPYDRLSELSDRVFAAAQLSGMGLTHLPVLYSFGGLERQALEGGQLRFGNDLDRFVALVDDCAAGLAHLPPDARLGVAPHSLRAVSPQDLSALVSARPQGPVHIHIAEQQKEVADVKAKFGQTPVAWLLDHQDVSARWCLIHATHMTETETRALAQSGAVAGLCPITEANLGDGPFNGPAYLAAHGAFGIGSDSNVRISLTEELRMLEYSQRLRDMARNLMVVGEGSVGQTLYTRAATGGAQALGRDAGAIKVGALADLVAIDSTSAALCGLHAPQLLDGLCFAASDAVVTDTWSAGRHMVQAGRHRHRDQILSRYKAALGQILEDL